MRRVIGIGETIFDIIFKNDQPISATPGGSSFNSIVSLGRAGVPCSFVSETGDDHIGRLICDYMEKNGIDSKNISIGKRSNSPVALAFLDDNNDADYIFFKDHPNDKLEAELPIVNKDDIVLFGSFYAINPVIRERVKTFLTYAKSQGAILYYDINFRKSHIDDIPNVLDNINDNFKLADVVRGSADDFGYLYNTNDPCEVYKRIGTLCSNFIYTAGASSVHMFTSKFKFDYPVKPVVTVSTIGAGDNFNSGVLYGMISGEVTSESLDSLSKDDWRKLISLGEAFAANVCASTGNSIDAEFAQSLRSI